MSEQPQKRGRGRPRKYPLPVTATAVKPQTPAQRRRICANCEHWERIVKRTRYGFRLVGYCRRFPGPVELEDQPPVIVEETDRCGEFKDCRPPDLEIKP
jgi:hypothetical protein